MIQDSHAMFLFKFGPYKYMQDLKKGKISFSCPGKYIDIARKTGNDEQGDVNEGVFARLKIGDSNIRVVREFFNLFFCEQLFTHKFSSRPI